MKGFGVTVRDGHTGKRYRGERRAEVERGWCCSPDAAGGTVMNSICLIFWFAVSVFHVPFKNQCLVAGKKTACLPCLDHFASGLWQ